MKTICVLLVLRTISLCAALEDVAGSSPNATEGACGEGEKGETARRTGPVDPPINLTPIHEFQKIYNEHVSQMKKYQEDLVDHMKEQTDQVAQHGRDLASRLSDHFKSGHRTYHSGASGGDSRKFSQNMSDPNIVDGFNTGGIRNDGRPKFSSMLSTNHRSNVNGQPADEPKKKFKDNGTRHLAKTPPPVVAEGFPGAARKSGKGNEEGGPRIYKFQSVYNDLIPQMDQYQSHLATRMKDEASKSAQHGTDLTNRLLNHFISQHKTFVSGSVPARKTSKNMGNANIGDEFNAARGGVGGGVRPKFDSVVFTNCSGLANG